MSFVIIIAYIFIRSYYQCWDVAYRACLKLSVHTFQKFFVVQEALHIMKPTIHMA